MTILKKITNVSFPEFLLLTLIISFIIVIFKNFYNNFSKKEGFIERKLDFIKKTDKDVYDDFYVDIYDDLVYNNVKNNYEIDRIFKSDTPNKQHKILDIGCSTGHHVYLLNNNNNNNDNNDNDDNDNDDNVIGIDNSPSMIKKAKKNYPDLHFKLCDALNSMAFPADTFTHITCLYYTIYYMKNKKLFLDNCFNWLQPGGVLILHLVDMHKFDPIIPIATSIPYNNDSHKVRNTESIVKFDTLDYKSNFNIDKSIDANSINLDKPNAVFKETIKLKNPKSVRINDHNLYMSTQNSILALAREIGFSMQSVNEMSDIGYDHNFLYVLQK